MADTENGPDNPQDHQMTDLGSNLSLTVKRRLYTQDLLDSEYTDHSVTPSVKDRFRDACSCSCSCFLRFLLGYFPIIGVIRNYSWRKNLLDDFISGLAVSFLQMPQGLALGLLASVPPVYGLYTTFYPVLIYLIFGTCHHISLGTNAVLSLLTAGIVESEVESFMAKHSGGSSALDSSSNDISMGLDSATTIAAASTLSQDEIDAYKVGVASAIAFVSGLFLLAMGLLKLGFITSYMSPSFVRGFTTAAAFHIVTSQVPKMLHIRVPPHTGAGKLVKIYIDIFKQIDESNPADVIVSAISIVFLLGVTIFINERYHDKLRVPIPVQLIIVVVSTVVSYLAELEDKCGLAVVGDVPLGLPAPRMPDTDVMGRIVVDSFIIAILIFTLTITLARLMADSHNYAVDSDQELVAYGLCNFLSSFFQCIASCTAPPRTMILSNTRSKSMLNGVVTVVFILVVLLAAGQLFYDLPIPVLAVMIATALKNLLLQVRQLPELWRVNKPDFFIWAFTFLAGVFGDLDIGIAVGVGLSILTVIVKSQLVSGMVGALSKTEDLVLFGTDRDGMKESSHFRIFHFPSQLFFANVERFAKELFSKALNPAHLHPVASEEKNGVKENFSSEEGTVKKEGQGVRYVILECSAMTYVDIAGATALKKVCGQYKKVGVTLLLAKCPTSTLQLLDRAGYFKTTDRSTAFYDIYDAVNYIQQTHV